MSLKFEEFDCSKNLKDQREMFTLCFPETKGQHAETEEHYNWKFHSYPSSKKSFEYSVYEENQILGYYAALPYQYNINGEILTSGMVCDVMTHPKARGKGIFTKIGHFSTNHMKDNNVHFTTGYPIRPEVIPGHLKVGWEAPFHLPMYLKPLKADDILKSKSIGFLSPPVNFCISLFTSITRLLRPSNSNIVTKVLSYEELLAETQYSNFLDQWNSLQKYYLIKNKDFLKWRLGSNSKDYIIFACYEDQKLCGLAIAKHTTLNEINSLALLDIMMLDNNKLANTLINQLTQYAHKIEAQVIVTMISRHWAKRYNLVKNGFLKTPFKFTFITKALNLDCHLNEFLNEKNWHLTWIDSDDL